MRLRSPWTLAALGAALLAVGCQGMYFLMANEPKKKVAAEFDKLGGKTTAIIVWADQATLDEDFAARYRVADGLRYYVGRVVPQARFADIRDITDYQERSASDWEGESNVSLGQRFKSDYVLRVDLLEYTTRARDSREVRKGRVRATVAVYDVSAPADSHPVYATEIVASYPQDQKADVLNLRDIDIINGALQVFCDKVAAKFHDHEEAY